MFLCNLLIIIGVYSIALSTFLSKEIYDTKILQKLDEVKRTFNFEFIIY